MDEETTAAVTWGPRLAWLGRCAAVFVLGYLWGTTWPASPLQALRGTYRLILCVPAPSDTEGPHGDDFHRCASQPLPLPTQQACQSAQQAARWMLDAEAELGEHDEPVKIICTPTRDMHTHGPAQDSAPATT